MRILFVDDEPRILTGLRRMLRSHRSEWEMVFAGGGGEALEQCASATFDVVVSDARMPGMDGYKLLEELTRLYPDTVRMILSGQCSRSSVLKCVGVTHQFLSKPCDPEILKSALRRTCEMRDCLHDKATRRAISRLQSLPSQTAVYAELVDQVGSPVASIEKVAEIISRDVAMCMKTMQLVSSGFFGTPQRVTDAAHAVKLIGLETIDALLASSAAFQPGNSEDDWEDDIQALTDHSLAVSAAAKRIAETVSDERALVGDAHLAGMLHKVGTLALCGGRLGCSPEPRFTRERQDTAARQNSKADPGGYLAALWGLPDPIVQAIAHHRAPGCCSEQTFTPLTAVHVANSILGQSQGQSNGGTDTLDMDYLRRTGCADHLESWRGICATCRPEGVLQ